jgi:hypothetical protein
MNDRLARLRRQRSWASGGRRGTAALEEVMILAVMIPLVLAAFFLSRAMCSYVYKIISSLVGWPYL